MPVIREQPRLFIRLRHAVPFLRSAVAHDLSVS
jgi:hypothetical protein